MPTYLPTATQATLARLVEQMSDVTHRIGNASAELFVQKRAVCIDCLSGGGQVYRAVVDITIPIQVQDCISTTTQQWRTRDAILE